MHYSTLTHVHTSEIRTYRKRTVLQHPKYTLHSNLTIMLPSYCENSSTYSFLPHAKPPETISRTDTLLIYLFEYKRGGLISSDR